MKRTEAKLFKRWDIAVFAVILLCAVLLFSFGIGEESGELTVTVGESVKTYPLENDRVFKIENNGISVTVSITDGEVFVKSSDCPDKVCVSSGRISKIGQIIVCAPAEISLRITGGEGGELDAVTG